MTGFDFVDKSLSGYNISTNRSSVLLQKESSQ